MGDWTPSWSHNAPTNYFEDYGGKGPKTFNPDDMTAEGLHESKMMDASEMARRPKPACPSCAKKKEEEKKRDPNGRHVTQTTSAQVGPVVYGKTTDLTTGQHWTTVGAQLPPGLNVTNEVCVVNPLPGNTAEDVIGGYSNNISVTGEGISPEASVAVNGSGSQTCVGVNVGVGSPVTTGVTYSW